jgi:hypothetical protein
MLRRLPFALGWMTKRPIPHEVTDDWLEPLLSRREIRRDLTKYLRTAREGDLVAAAEGLPRFDRPALVVWTLIPEDQPGRLARAIRQFIHTTPLPPI